MSSPLIGAVVRVLALAAGWVALWGEISVANIFWGIVVGIGVTLAFPSHTNGNGFRPIAMLVLLARFVVMLVLATAQVVVAVLRPRLHLDQAIVAVPLVTDDRVIATMVANGTSLTPGTLTIDLGPEPSPGEGWILYVHVLNLTSAADVIASAHKLEALTTAAFPPPDHRRDGTGDRP